MSTLVTFVLIMFLWGWAGIALLEVIGSLCFFLMTELISDSSDSDGPVVWLLSLRWCAP